MSAINNPSFLLSTYNKLKDFDIETCIFGGWAEELQKMITPRAHSDIDLLYHTDTLKVVDRFLKTNNVTEIVGKHFVHKRAFELSGIRVEIFIVNTKNNALVTNFFGKYEFIWPDDTFQDRIMIGNMAVGVASPRALKSYRRCHQEIMRSYDRDTSIGS